LISETTVVKRFVGVRRSIAERYRPLSLPLAPIFHQGRNEDKKRTALCISRTAKHGE
jgi:hypothetical protein